jgi:hypothetical protein
MFKIFKYIWIGITYAPTVIRAIGQIKSAAKELTDKEEE